jgi:hypothetical protein
MEGSMRLISLAVPTLALAAGLFSALTLGVSPASALPPATGSKCDSSWVNNPGAMACFIKGEDESHAGVRHPHYVACVGGTTFCCVDNDAGHQTCDAQEHTTGATQTDWKNALLGAHKTMLMRMGRFTERPGPLRSEIPKAATKP